MKFFFYKNIFQTLFLPIVTTLIVLPILFFSSNLNYAMQTDSAPIDLKTMKIVEDNKISVFADFDGPHPPSTEQSLSYRAVGLHPSSCQTALRTLSRYENFPQYVGFLKKSQYNDAKEELFLQFSLESLGLGFTLNFKLPRMKKPGTYPFNFMTGIFPGLEGKIHVMPHNHPKTHEKRCLFYVEASWRGSDSGVPSTLMEIFLHTVTTVGMEKLFRASSL